MPLRFRTAARTLLSVGLFLHASSALICQIATKQPKAISFAVVSVRPSSAEARSELKITDDEIVERGNTLLWILELAYGLPEEKFVIGAPSWITTQRFDIEAKVDEEDLAAFEAMKQDQKVTLLQAVLKDRFRLQSHDETRIFPQYGLYISKGGPKPALHPALPNEQRAWKINSTYHLEAKNMKIADLCYMVLSTEAQELVVDETGLTGNYNFELSWGRPDPVATSGSPSEAPEIFDAVKQQLGLELIRRKVPSRVLVIDTIERPTAN